MKVLIVGLGSIALKHVKALKKIVPDVSVYALRSSLDAGDTEGVINIFDLKMLDSLTIDFAIISNPTAHHKQMIDALIPYRIPLFIEKPLFNNLDAADTLQKINENHIQTYIACNLRFLDAISFVKEFLKDKRINEVNSYCGSYLPDWRPGRNFREIYSANKDMGGGVHIDLIHEIDYVYWLFGAPEEVVSVKTNRSSLDISAIDYAVYLLKYPAFCTSVVLNYYRRDAKRTLEIVLDEGTVNVDLLKNTVTFKGEVIHSSDRSISDTYEDQLRFFLDNILQNKIKFNSINEAFEILKLCLGTS